MYLNIVNIVIAQKIIDVTFTKILNVNVAS